MKFRITALFALLIAILLLCGASPIASSSSLGARISARLAATSFTSAKASKVKLIYSFSATSRHFSYLLTRKAGTKWKSVKRVKKTGRFSGKHTMSVKAVFAGHAIGVGKYRLKLSADTGSKTLLFTVKKTSSGGGDTTPGGGGSNTTPPPGAFNKTSPITGATDQTNTPLLSWAASTKATSYSYCIDTTNNDSCDTSWVSTSTATSASLSGLTLGATYYWQARATNAEGTTDADGGSWFSFTVSEPTAGYWEATGLSGPSGNGLGFVTVTSVFFNVGADSSTVSDFGFAYSYQDLYCSGDDGRSWLESPSAPIASGQFSDPSGTQIWGEQTGSLADGTGDFSGTFDSPTTAHGTAKLWTTIQCGGAIHFQDVALGPFSWTAAWKSAS
jgi:hypothetical protein